MPFRSVQNHAFASGLILTLLQGAQKPPIPPPDATQAPQVTFSARTVLITVPVVVTDKKGQHLRGLKQADFSVEENGKKREIASFQEILISGRPAKPATPSAFPLSNFAARTEGESLTTIINLDLLNTPYLSQTNAREKLLKFLQAHVNDAGPTSLTVLTSHGLRLVHSFTTDPSVLIEAMKRLESRTAWQDEAALGKLADINSTAAFDQSLGANPTPGQLQQAEASALAQAVAQTADGQFVFQQQRDATYVTLSALEELAQSAAGIPGRKSLIWVTGGLPFTLVDPTAAAIDTTMFDDYQRTWQALNDANVSVYPIDANGLLAEGVNMQNRLPQAETSPTFGSRRSGLPGFNIPNTRNLQDSMRNFAYATGGEPCVNRNDLDQCVGLAIQDSSQYYMLAYYLPSDDRKPGWRKLKVKVSAPHHEVRARNAVYVGEPKADNPHDTEHQFEIVFSSPLDYTAVPLGLKFGGITPGENGARKVAFSVFLQPNGFTTEDNWIKLNVHFVATDVKNKSILVFSKRFLAHLKPGAVTDLMQNGFSYNGEMNLAPGRYQMKLLVRDDLNAKFGSIQAPLLVQ
ncbi:MAG: VWA domain-containing protein [Terriglobales bacterium]